MYNRRSIRLAGYDYTQAGAYFVTICVYERCCLLGEIVDRRVILSDIGEIVVACWNWLAQRYTYVELDEWVAMPNHLHGIVVITDSAPTQVAAVRRKTLGSLLGAFKTVSTRRVNAVGGSAGFLWQRGFYEHIIRDEAELDRIRQYIADNPARWSEDRENETGSPKPPAEPWQV